MLTIIVFLPNFLSSLMHPTAHQSNSTELPIRYTPEPKTITAPPICVCVCEREREIQLMKQNFHII